MTLVGVTSEYARLGAADELFALSIGSLHRARRSLDPTSVDAAVDALADASELLFLGSGASGIVAADAQQRFPQFGVPCQAPADSHQQLVAAAMSGHRSVTVAISRTARTPETLRAARAAKDAGATVIALTGRPGPLTRTADIALVVRTASRLAALVVVDVLATGVALRHGTERPARVVPLRAGGAGGRLVGPAQNA